MVVVEFLVKKVVILDSGRNYLIVKEVASSFAEIGAPFCYYVIYIFAKNI